MVGKLVRRTIKAKSEEHITFIVERRSTSRLLRIYSYDKRAKVEDDFVVLEANLFNSLVNLRDKYFHDGIWVVFEII